MRQGASNVFSDLLPGRPGPFTPKLIEVRPQDGERLIDNLSTGIKQTQRIGLGFIGQAHIVG
jgi:hypothetical protein